MKCQHCSAELLKKSDGKVKFRTSILIWSDSGDCTTICKFCKSETAVPIKINASAPIENKRIMLHRRKIASK